MLGRDDLASSDKEETTTSEPWRIYLDSIPTQPSAFTQFKTTSRAMYMDARARVGIRDFQEPAEVILWNPERQLMEGSLTTLFMFRSGRWVTPPISSGGQEGTTRRWLLDRGLCEEAVISLDSVEDGEDCYLSNGVKGVIWGRMTLQAPTDCAV